MQVVLREASRPQGEAMLLFSVKRGVCAHLAVCACVHAHCYFLLLCMPGEL